MNENKEQVVDAVRALAARRARAEITAEFEPQLEALREKASELKELREQLKDLKQAASHDEQHGGDNG